MIKVSVIVPVYNQEQYLSQCLDSICVQTLKTIEIICVNDGSTDGSLSILLEYQKKDSRICIINQENKGLGAARNVGVLAAHGDYLVFVDSDDFVEVTMLEKLYWKAVTNDADVVLCNFSTFDTITKKTVIYRDSKYYHHLEEKGCFCALEEPDIVRNIGVWDRIYKHSFVEAYKLNNPEGVVYEDALFSFQTLIFAKRICVLNQSLYYYRKNTGKAITDHEILNDAYKFDFIKNALEIKHFLMQEGVYLNFRDSYVVYILQNALWHQSNIMSYCCFNEFFHQIDQLLDHQELCMALKNKYLSWKVKLYILELRFHVCLLCYSIFFLKRKKIRGKLN